jgi:hypothetical protein
MRLALLLLAALASSTAHSQWVDVTDPAELRRIAVGRPIEVFLENGQPGAGVLHRPDGTATVTAPILQWARDWAIRDGKWCAHERLGPAWKDIWICSTVQRNPAEPDRYRTVRTDAEIAKAPQPVPKVLYWKVGPAAR